MKAKATLKYEASNQIGFNQIIYPKFRGSIWFDNVTFTAFEIEIILDKEIFILPASEKEIIIEILDSSTAHLLKIDDVVDWGVPYKALGNIWIKEIIIPCKKDYFGSKK